MNTTQWFTGLAGLAVLGLIAIVALFWLLFPLLVYYSLQRIEKLLKESNRLLDDIGTNRAADEWEKRHPVKELLP